MRSLILATILMPCAIWLASAQSPEPLPKFEAADVHVSAKTQNPFARFNPVRNGRYEVKTASMVDLIRTAYGFDPDKVLGGPSWLEMDRFDITGKVPADTPPEAQKQMLQALLEDRFKLVVHKESRPLPTYALIAGKKPNLKESAGTEESGCKPQSPAGPAPGTPGGEGRIMLMMGNANGGAPTQLVLGPGMTVHYACRNMTMAAFATSLRGMIGANVGNNPVKEETGLKGNYNFDLKFSISLIGPAMQNESDRITIFEAVDKQLGLKLEERPVPTPVIVVDSVNRKPSDNPAGTAEALPPIPVPTEFEVASVKLVEGGMNAGPRMSRFSMQPGGRFVAEGMPLSFFLQRAFNANNRDAILGMPPFANSDRYDITAKTPSGGPQMTTMDQEALAPMILALLKERFKLEYHTEERPVTAYALVAGKPKLKKANPDSRTKCTNGAAPPGSPPGSRALTCQNVTLAQFAERLQGLTPDTTWPVEDNTKLDGNWDISLVFSMGPAMVMARGGGDGPGAPPPPPPPPGGMAPAGMTSAAEPVDGYTIFEAIEKQLGLKLEKQKRSAPVIVIDHLEQKPTEN